MTAGLKYVLSAGGLAALAGGWFAVHAEFRPLPELRMEQAAAFASQPPVIPAVALLIDTPIVPALPEGNQGEAALRLNSVEGIGLNDSIMELIRKKGQPAAVHNDSRLSDLEVYDYGTIDVAFRGGDLLYVEVGAEAGTVTIDGTQVSFEPEALRHILGEPDFDAEDGWGYKRGFGAIKFYTDPATGQIRSVHFFDAVGI